MKLDSIFVPINDLSSAKTECTILSRQFSGSTIVEFAAKFTSQSVASLANSR